MRESIESFLQELNEKKKALLASLLSSQSSVKELQARLSVGDEASKQILGGTLVATDSPSQYEEVSIDRSDEYILDIDSDEQGGQEGRKGSSAENSCSSDSEPTPIKRSVGKNVQETVFLTEEEDKSKASALFMKVIDRTGGKQHNHITAFAVLKEVLYDAIIDNTPEEARSNLQMVVEILNFEDKQKQKILELFDEHRDLLEETKIASLKKETKGLTNFLRKAKVVSGEEASKKDNLNEGFKSIGYSESGAIALSKMVKYAAKYDEEQIDRYKRAIRSYARKQIGKLVAGEMLEILSKANKAKFASAKDDRDKDESFHRRNENESISNLRLFGKLCCFINSVTKTGSDEKRKKLIESFRGDFLETIRISYPSIISEETINERFRQFVCKFFHDKEQRIDGDEFLKIFNIEPRTIDDNFIRCIKLKIEEPSSFCHSQVGKEINQLFDFRFIKDQRVEQNLLDYQTLQEALSNHIILTFAAFKDLRNLEDSLKESIKIAFINCVLSQPQKDEGGTRYNSFGQGWESFSIGGRKLISRMLLEEVNSRIKVDKSKSSYYYRYVDDPKSVSKRQKVDHQPHQMHP